jgi:hypothetical protein
VFFVEHSGTLVSRLLEISNVSQDPQCAKVIAQTKESLRAMKLHIIDYRLRVLLLSLRNPVETTDISKDHEEKKGA